MADWTSVIARIITAPFCIDAGLLFPSSARQVAWTVLATPF